VPEVIAIEPEPFSRSSPGDETAYAAFSRDTRSALQLLLELSCSACHASAAALVVVDGELERTLATSGIAPYAVPKQRGFCNQLRHAVEPTLARAEQLRAAGVQLPFADPWPQWVWQMRPLHSWGSAQSLLWVAKPADQPYGPEELHAIERCSRLAERELTLLGRNKEIIVQRERATVEIAKFHEQLHRQHLLYRELAKHLPGTAVLIYDVDLQVRVQEGWQALDWPHEDSHVQVGQHVAQYFAPRDVGRIDSACRQAIERQRVTFEIQVAARSYELSAGPLPDTDGNVVFGILLVRDITDGRAERAHSAAVTARLEALVESLEDGILVQDEHLRVQLCSNRLRRLIQLDGEEDASIFRDGHALMARMASVCFIPEAFEESTCRLIEARAAQRNELVYLADMRVIERDYVPLMADDRHIGHLWVYRDVTQREQTKDLLQQQADQLRALSLVDELTGLYNRRGFLTLATQQLKLCDRTMRPALVVFVDLDGMKRINDELGHEFGDQALIETANVLRNCMRYSDVIARLGGDEFVALAIDAASDTTEGIQRRLNEGLAKNNNKPDRAFELQFSIGIAPYDPASAEMVEEVLARADGLMYEQKRARKTERK
jgi:diguanylate cyclase (GGDEF)-like protein